jgi:hypothetical protein
MKTFLLSLILFLTSFSFSQIDGIIKTSLLNNINNYRISKDLGSMDTTTETNIIAKQVYEIYGKVEPIMLLNEIGVSDNWAIYMVQRIQFYIISDRKTHPTVDKGIQLYMSDTLKTKDCEWYYKDNTNEPKPFLFGIYVQKINDGEHYDTYEMMFIVLRNIPMKYKCFLPIEENK